MKKEVTGLFLFAHSIILSAQITTSEIIVEEIDSTVINGDVNILRELSTQKISMNGLHMATLPFTLKGLTTATDKIRITPHGLTGSDFIYIQVEISTRLDTWGAFLTAELRANVTYRNDQSRYVHHAQTTEHYRNYHQNGVHGAYLDSPTFSTSTGALTIRLHGRETNHDHTGVAFIKILSNNKSITYTIEELNP